MRALYIFIMYVLICSINGGYGDQEAEQNNNTIIEQALRTHTVLLDDYHLVIRQIATDVNIYRSYGTVSVVFYPVMRDVTEARFTFQSEDIHLNEIGLCSSKTIVVNLKNGAYPALNPDGYDFPKEFISSSKREQIHTLELVSGGKNISYSIINPKPGYWYAVVYIKWEDPKTQAVMPHGLLPNCQTILYTDLQVKREENIELIDCYTGIIIDYDGLPTVFKCMSLDSVEAISLHINIAKFTETDVQELFFRVEASSIPTEDNYILYCVFDPKANNAPVITFTPHPSTWHYIQLGRVNSNVSNLTNCESYYLRTDFDDLSNQTISDLVRDDKGRFFGFGYSLPSDNMKDATSRIKITSSEVKILRFIVNQFLDIGGSLAISAGLVMNMKYSKKYKTDFKVSSLLALTTDNHFVRAVICMDIGHPSMPLNSGHCKYNDKVKLALFVLNSTDSESIYDKTYIPFPDSGMWYLTLKIFCDDVECNCKTNESTYNVPTLDKDKTPDVIYSEDNVTRVATSQCNATVMLKVSSMSCVNGRCSNHGSCQLKPFGGLVMSFCLCSAGYGSWDCSDGSRTESTGYKLMSVLCLTLSNLFFILSIYVAIIRYYYAEATLYACTMFFSTFYHACDASPEVAYCITQGYILQFGDFYCGIMSFWVTLLAMSIIDNQFKSSLHLTGGVAIALLTTWNMHSFISFLLPTAVGAVILFTSWYLDYKKNRKMKYSVTYYLRYMPVGLMLVFAGCLCFVFLQTESNYIVVHSFWHIVIALSIVFLLPDTRQDNGNAFTPSLNTFNICKYFRKRQPTIAPDPQ